MSELVPAGSQKAELYVPGADISGHESYLGFTYNGRHSSEFGIMRVSSSNRYSDSLLPTLQDKTVQVPGNDGMYFFGSYYTQRQFTVDFAFDAMTDVQLQSMRLWLGDKKLHPLIFDETPYKAYTAKVTGTANIKHICFDTQEVVSNQTVTRRIYKGEGSIQFTCYYPFARSVHKFLNEYTDVDNQSEWEQGSRMLQSNTGYDVFTDRICPLYNPGDVATHWKLTIIPYNTLIPAGRLSLMKQISENNYEEIAALIMNQCDTQSLSKVVFDSKTKLIEGYNNSGIKDGSIFNGNISGGDFMMIPPDTLDQYRFEVIGFGAPSSGGWNTGTGHTLGSIEYDYLYF